MDDAPGLGSLGAAPAPVRAAGALVLLEGVALAALGAGYAVSGVLGSPEDRLATVLAGAFALAVGLVLVPVGRGLGRVRGWALSPTVVTQVIVLVVAVGLLQGHVLAVGVPLLLLGAAVLYLVATPPARAAFRGPG